MTFVPLFNAQNYSVFDKTTCQGDTFFLFLTYYAFLHCNVPNIVSNHWGCDRYTEKWLLFHCSMPKFILYLKKNHMSRGRIFYWFLIFNAFSQCNVPKRDHNHWWCDRYTEKLLLFHHSMPKLILYLKKKKTCHGDTFGGIFIHFPNHLCHNPKQIILTIDGNTKTTQFSSFI